MSKNFRLDWGTPPKPNIWRARELTFGQPLRIVEVLSEVMLGALEISATEVVYFPNASSWNSNTKTLCHIAEGDRERLESSYFYNKYIKPFIERGEIKIREGFKVASSEMTVGELIEAKPESISLPWGSPPKPNIWKTNRVSYRDDRVRYIVQSPAIAKHNVLKNYNREILSFEIEFRKEARGFVDGKVYIKSSGGILDEIIVARALPSTKLSLFLKEAWKNISESSMRGNYFTEGMKIASSNESFEAQCTPIGKTFRLDWGDPPKPNLWKFTFQGSGKWDILSEKSYVFDIESPLIKEGRLLFTITKTKSMQHELWLRGSSMRGEIKKYYHGDNKNIEHVMRGFWEREKKKIKAYFLKSGMKVASAEVPFDDLLELSYLGKTFRLDWGDPPKPNLWKFKLKGQDKRSKLLNFEIESPLIKESPSVIDGKLYNLEDKLYVRVQKSTDFYNIWVRDVLGKMSIKTTIPLKMNVSGSIEELMRIFWGYYANTIKKDLLKSGMKVASNHSSFSSQLSVTGKTFRLDWGDPPKPNLWRFTLQGSERDSLGEESYRFEIESPLIKERRLLFTITKIKNSMQYELRLHDKSMRVKNYYHGDNKNIEHVMRGFWEREKEKIKAYFLKPSMKVASASTINSLDFKSFLEMRHVDKEISLPWGNPPKPNIWKAEAKGVHNHKIITISSPILKDTLTIELKVDGSWGGTVVGSNIRSGYIQYLAWGFELSKYEGQTLNDFLKDIWTRKVSGDKRLIKDNMKVASSVSGSMSFLEFLYTKQVNAEISLPWGSPPKPNLWKAKVSDKTIQGVDVYKEIHISSPVLKEDLVYFFVVSDYNNKTYVVFKLFSKDSNKIIHSYTHPLADYKRYTLYDVLKNTYEYIIAPTLKENILKEGLKVASKKGSSNVI